MPDLFNIKKNIGGKPHLKARENASSFIFAGKPRCN